MREGVNKVALCLFEHNEKAYHAAVRMMEQYGKAAIIHSTGTGKSYIANKMTLGEAVVRGILPAPLILDVVNNFEGLTSISGLQSEMQEAVHWLYANGEGDKIVTERFEVIEQVHDCRVLFEQLQASLSSSWEHYFSEASIYYVEHGDLNVPAEYVSPSGYNLGNWVKRQRYTRHNPEKSCAVLTEERIAKLDAIGMRWEKADSRPRRLELAQGPHRESEKLNVSANHKTGEEIGLCS